MPIKLTSRPSGYAVTKLYKDALATFRNEIYIVSDVITGDQILLERNIYEAMKQRIFLFDPNLTLNLPDISADLDPSEYYPEFINKVKIREMKKIICKMDENLLQGFICHECHTFVKKTSFINTINHFVFECPLCSTKEKRHYLAQAPILLYNNQSNSDRKPPLILKSISAKSCPVCQRSGQSSWMGLYIKDQRRPMFSLTRQCKQCNHEEQLFTPQYKPILPSEQLTKGISVSISSEKKPETIEFVDLLNREFVEGIYYSDNVKVYQVTFGYKLGQYTTTLTKPLKDEYYGRKLETQGIIIKLKPEVYQKSKQYLKQLYEKDPALFNQFEKDLKQALVDEELQLKRWVLHSLTNSLLVMLPIFTGLPASEYGGSYNLNDNKVIIYDNQQGGVGGCRKFKEDPTIFYDYFDWVIKTVTRCDCRNKCAKCIVLEHDGEVNQALNRHLLVPIFDNIETNYD